MNQRNQLRYDAERILTALCKANGEAVRRLLAPAVDEVLKAVREGTCTSLASWANRQCDTAAVRTAIFASCTAVLRLIESSEPSQFAAVDRLLLAARHMIAREAGAVAA